MPFYNNGNEIYKNVGVMHAVVFADRAQEAKSAQVVGHNQNFDGLKKRKNSDRNGQKSEKSKSSNKKCSSWSRLGAKKVNFLIKIAWSRFAKMLSPLEQEQQFWKNVMQKVSWSIKIMKEASWSLHFWCKFVTNLVEDKFFAFGSASAERNESHQNQVDAHFG